MKKWIIIFFIGLISAIAMIYVLIPDRIKINKSVVIQNNIQGIYRSFSDEKNWAKWWPVKIAGSEIQHSLNGNNYLISDKTNFSIFIDIVNEKGKYPSSLNFIPLTKNSFKLEWDTEIPSSNNPLKRLQAYISAICIKDGFNKIITAIHSYYINTDRVYGYDIRREFVKDSAFVFTSDSIKGYPTTDMIYAKIAELRNYIASQNAIATDSPMVNIYTKDSFYFQTKVALPVNKRLPTSGRIFYRWMLPRGNMLITNVTGDTKKVEEAYKVVENYVSDYSLTAPAIPFYSFITNRQAEKDSSKWVTRIYYPVMYY